MRADDDDFRDSCVLEKAVEMLNADPEIVMAFGNARFLYPETGGMTDLVPTEYFPFERERYARLKRYLSFYFNEGKGLLLFGVWRRRVLGPKIPRTYYYGWDANIVLEGLTKGPFGYVDADFFDKSMKIGPKMNAPSARFLNTLMNRMQKFFSPFFYVNLAIIVRSRDLALWEKIRLVGVQFFVMTRLFFARRT